ncbi:MAG: uroporphyrinogen decarboxylase family protein [Chloroflexota bacterium]|jgi:uroporphyrinogen decarboxylase
MESSRDRVLKAVRHEQPDVVPVNFSNFYDPAQWFDHFDVDDSSALRERLGFDIEYARPVYTGPYAERNLDIWGTPIEGVFGADGVGYSGERNGYPLARAETVADIDRFPWPDPDDFDYDAGARALQAIPDSKAKRLDCKYGIRQEGSPPAESQGGGSWLPLVCTLFNLFGLEQTLINFRSAPRLNEAALKHVETFTLEFVRRSLDAAGGQADFFFYGDDFATQQGLMISPEDWRRYLKPVFGSVFATVKERGVKVWFHSCGQFRPVLPDLIDMGLDVWEAVQVHLEGNDPRALKRDFGRHITFFGAISTQQTLPFGTTEQVRAEVRERIRVLGEGGGYICGPDHGVMPDIPIENGLALIDEARGFRF